MSEEDVVDTGATAQTESSRLIRWEMLITGVAMGLLVAGLAAWTTLNVGLSAPVFVVAFLAVTYVAYQKELPDEALGLGLNIAAVVVFLVPIVVYLSNVFGGGPNAIPGTGMTIGSLKDLLIWGAAFLILGIIVASVACYFHVEARKKQRSW